MLAVPFKSFLINENVELKEQVDSDKVSISRQN